MRWKEAERSMLLVGRDLSPFVRRTATLLNVLRMRYKRRIVSAAEHAEEIRSHNPLGRVPALVVTPRHPTPRC